MHDLFLRRWHLTLVLYQLFTWSTVPHRNHGHGRGRGTHIHVVFRASLLVTKYRARNLQNKD